MKFSLNIVMVVLCLNYVLSATETNALPITPVSVDASSTFVNYDQDNLINDSGISEGFHDDDYRNMWMSDTKDPNVELIFDLGDVYMITGADIWQYNAFFALDRGVKDFNVFNSIGGIDFYFLTAASLSQSMGGSIPAQNIEFETVARYIRFSSITNYGDLNYSGLSEVKFDGMPNEINPIPEPATIFLLIIGFLGIAGYSKKKKISISS